MQRRFVATPAASASLLRRAVACSNQVSCGSGTSGLQTILVPLHSDGGIVYTLLGQDLEFQFDCTASRDIQCLQSGDFLHSALVGNATIVNADGQVVSGAVITSGSGYDYSQPISNGEGSLHLHLRDFGVKSLIRLDKSPTRFSASSAASSFIPFCYTGAFPQLQPRR
jgi:hypothetical protein